MRYGVEVENEIVRHFFGKVGHSDLVLLRWPEVARCMH